MQLWVKSSKSKREKTNGKTLIISTVIRIIWFTKNLSAITKSRPHYLTYFQDNIFNLLCILWSVFWILFMGGFKKRGRWGTCLPREIFEWYLLYTLFNNLLKQKFTHLIIDFLLLLCPEKCSKTLSLLQKIFRVLSSSRTIPEDTHSCVLDFIVSITRRVTQCRVFLFSHCFWLM